VDAVSLNYCLFAIKWSAFVSLRLQKLSLCDGLIGDREQIKKKVKELDQICGVN